MNWTMMSQSVLTALCTTAALAVALFFVNRLKLRFKTDDRIDELMKRMERAEKRGEARRREQRVLMCAVDSLMDVVKGKRLNGELEAAQRELRAVIFELGKASDDS